VEEFPNSLKILDVSSCSMLNSSLFSILSKTKECELSINCSLIALREGTWISFYQHLQSLEILKLVELNWSGNSIDARLFCFFDFSETEWMCQ
jgi:hypothetical protein